MTHSVLRKTLMKMIPMHSVTAVNTLTRKQLLFTLGRDITIQVQVDSLAVTHSPEEDLIRLV